MKLGALYYPTEDNEGNKISFDSLFIPYIYKEIYFDGVYIDVLNGRKDMTILDIGANIGVTVQHFQPYAKRLLAVEPSPENFEALKKNKEYNKWDNVELFNMAIADKDGEMEFSQNTNNRTMNTLSTNVGTNINPNGYNTKTKVKAQGFDTFFKENNIEQVDFMKCDIEGSEDMVFRSESFAKVAHKIKAMEIAFHFPSWPNLADYIVSLGYTARRYNCAEVLLLFTRI